MMATLLLHPDTVKRISELENTEVLGGFDHDGTSYTAGRDEEHVRINVSVDPKELLEIIDRQLAHENSPTQTEPQTDYGRGYIKGLEWVRTEICKAFGV